MNAASKLSQLINILSLAVSGSDWPLIHFLAASREIGFDSKLRRLNSIANLLAVGILPNRFTSPALKAK